MARVEAVNIGVRYPVLTSSSRSLKNKILARTTGGRIGRGAGSVEIQALSQVSFTLSPGDRVALIGHNGSGKSTLLRVLAGIYHPTEGTAHVKGRVAALFDAAFGMDVDATGYENIGLRGRYLGLSPKDIQRHTDDIAEFSGLGEFLNMPLRTYSAGMSARLAFAISTSVEADVLLIDEGVGAADAAFMTKAKERLRHFVDRSPIALFASHERSTLENLCTRALVFQSGKLMFDGAVPAAFDRYQELVGAALPS